MLQTPEEKKRAITRLRRIKGQAEALERAIEINTGCGALLQQIVAMRGAANGLMAEVAESHLRETFGQDQKPSRQRTSGDLDNEIKDVMKIFGPISNNPILRCPDGSMNCLVILPPIAMRKPYSPDCPPNRQDDKRNKDRYR